jgi:cystathionine gamma-synthase
MGDRTLSPVDDYATDSWLVNAGRDHSQGAPLNVPIIPASNFLHGSPRAYARDDATRSWEALEEIVGGLEGGRAVAFSSGMAAISAVFQQPPTGSLVVIPEDCYQGVTALVRRAEQQHQWRVRRIAVTATEDWLRACEEADLIWLESPSNPLLQVADLRAICAAPRKPGALLGVDNTFATPLNQRPLALGADVSVQSATKYIGGHSDLLTGVATVRSEALHHALREVRELQGATPGSLEAFLAIRGARTMGLRLARMQTSAMLLAQRLSAHPAVAVTRYPGLPTHIGHELARTQMRGFGSVISFDVRGGAAEADAVVAALKLIQHATSLGSVESTVERRAAIPGQGHLPPSLLRLSVGIEDPEDLWRDLERSLRAVR